MRLSPLLLATISLLIVQGCESDNDQVSKTNDCIVRSSGFTSIEDRYILSLQSSRGTGSGGRKSINAVKLLERYGVDDSRILNQFEGEYAHIVIQASKDEIAALSADSSVIFVEQDKRARLCACFSVIEPKLVTWNVDKVGYGDGTGKTAWILDTGVELRHPDLNVDTIRSRSFIQDAPTAADDNGHGTHVAGVIGALNNRVGTLGVASGTRIVALKVLDYDGDGMLSDVLDALAYVRKNAAAGEVVNISLGVDETSDILDNEVKALAARGIYVVIAAGNEGAPAKNYSPGRTNGTNIYTVSAVDSTGRFATFSNYGNEAVDYAAPGVRILSTYTFGKYAIMSGTSMAAPHVSGILLINNGKVNSIGKALSDPDGSGDPLVHK